MIPSNAFIIRTSSDISHQYAETCATSCREVGINYEYFNGIENMCSYDAWTATGLDIKPGSMDHRKNTTDVDPSACCSVSHALVWKRIAESQQCAIVLEHDAIMLHEMKVDVPDGKIVVLGYKLTDPSKYDHKAAGPPRRVIDLPYHCGAHAYAITPKTATALLNELKISGGGGPIDNRFFMKRRWSKVPLAIMDPTPAIGWIRKSTIWESADTYTYSYIRSFSKHLKP